MRRKFGPCLIGVFKGSQTYSRGPTVQGEGSGTPLRRSASKSGRARCRRGPAPEWQSKFPAPYAIDVTPAQWRGGVARAALARD